jgi:RNA polymerase sigma factor (sigma-70 family)
MEPTAPQALWPVHLTDLALRLRAPLDPATRAALRGELWVVLQAALMRFLRAHAGARSASREDLEDLAATKALELLRRAESGAWDPGGRSAESVVGYVASMARHGLADLGRRNRREARSDDPAWESRVLDPGAAAGRTPPSHAEAEGREFAAALADCVERLEGRARRVWFFRAYFEMSSREIAAHPEVRLTAAHVDVVVQRARRALRECMERKGHDPGDAPAGAFLELWRSLERLRDPVGRPPEEADD